MNISDRQWKLFAIEELFTVSGTVTTPPSKLIKGGRTPRITCQAVNNGLEDTYANPPTEEGGVITIDSATDGAVKYQEYDFIATDHVEKLSLKSGEKMDRYAGLFVVSAITNSIGEKYGYGYKFSQTRIRRQTISLPVKTDGQPDWDFMTDYMKQQEQAILAKYKTYLTAIERERERERVEATSGRKWAEFSIDKIFNIKAGKRLTKASMVSGRTPFIGASDSNNGVTAFISNDNASRDSNILGVNYNGSVVETFYHPYECLFSDDVKRFSLKNYDGNKYVYLFLKSIIIKQKEKYQYGYKFNESRMLRQKIMLPVTDDGEPDYEYMEKSAKYTEAKLLARYVAYLDSRSTSYRK